MLVVIRNRHTDFARQLLKRGAAMYHTFQAEDSKGAVQLLLDHGADPTITDQADFPCWHWDKDPDLHKAKKKAARRARLRKFYRLD